MEKLKKKGDIIIVSFITLIYAIVSFINLGSTKNPQTFWNIQNAEDYAIVKLDETHFRKIKIYGGTGSGLFKLYISNDGETFTFFKLINSKDVFTWKISDDIRKAVYVKIVGEKPKSSLGEIVFYNNAGKLIKVLAVNENAKLIVDEQDLIPEEINFMTNTYFDEIYHPRTAYEYLNGLEVYEWTHPPLGKLLMAFSIAIFGMTPFAYRLMGNIAGILMIPVIYILAKDLFKNKKYAILAAIIMACDNFHFAQTRMATVDSFLVLFIMLSYMFMYKYIILESGTKLSKKLLMLFLSGLFMGMAIATKWSACFSSVGLAIIFFAKLIKTNIVKSSKIDKEKLEIEFNEKRWSKESTITVLSCVLFFVVIPVIIYCACYIPHKGVDSLKDVWDLQVKMYNYHSKLEATHSFSSKWYTWFIMQRPVWYYSGVVEKGMHSTIAGIGNPLIWWTGFLAMIYVFFKGIIKLNKECWFIIIAILTAIVPYLGINRIMFMYHYFPILPFLMLSIVVLIKDLEMKTKFKYITYIYSVLIFGVFIYFYPVVSGMTVTEEYIESTKWLDTWYY